MMRSTPANACSASGRSRPWVSEIRPILTCPYSPTRSASASLLALTLNPISAAVASAGTSSFGDLQGEQPEVIVMRLARRWAGAAVTEVPKSVRPWTAPSGKPLLLRIASLGGKEVVSAGML